MKLKNFVVAVLFSMCCTALAQQNDGGKGGLQNGSSSNSNSGAAANANVTVIQGNQGNGQSNGSNRQFTVALPGVASSPGPFPGLPLEGGKWQSYCPAIERSFSVRSINKMKGHGKIHFTPTSDTVLPPNNDDINLACYWPRDNSLVGDQVLGVVEVTGKYLWSEESALGLGLDACKRNTYTRRVAVRISAIRESATHGRSFGLGGSAAGMAMPAAENAGIAAATGGVLGTNRVREEDYPYFELLCLNDGSTELPPQPNPPTNLQQTVTPPPSSSPPIVVRVEVAQAPPLPLAQPTAPTSTDVCSVDELLAIYASHGIPEGFDINFEFNRSEIKDVIQEKPGSSRMITTRNREKIDILGNYLLAHKLANNACHVQLEGHACVLGDENHNLILAKDRAKAVLAALESQFGKGIVDQYVSLGKELADGKEFDWQDRRVIAREKGRSFDDRSKQQP